MLPVQLGTIVSSVGANTGNALFIICHHASSARMKRAVIETGRSRTRFPHVLVGFLFEGF